MQQNDRRRTQRPGTPTYCHVPVPWAVLHVNDDGIERFSITSNRLSTVCILEEDEPFDFDDDLRDEIAGNFAFMAAAHAAIPKLIAEVRRLRSHDTVIIVDAARR